MQRHAAQRRPYWREAASIILTAKQELTNSCERSAQTKQHVKFYDYVTLMMKRAPEMQFLPNNLVFPGGVISPVDYAPAWVSLYEQIAGCSMDEVTRLLHVAGERPPISHNTHGWVVPPDVVFRICSIREMFEESGVLLARTKAQCRTLSSNVSGHRQKRVQYGSVLSASECNGLREYRQRIQKDDTLFLEMCQNLDVVPDVWSLYEWANYLTPVSPTTCNLSSPPDKPYRFDTLFYACCVKRVPEMMHDQQEMVESKWVNPSELYDSPACCHQLVTPQMFELSRIANFAHLTDVAHHAMTRESLGVRRATSVWLQCKDGFFTIRDDDDMYPPYPDLEGRGPIMRAEESSTELLRGLHKVDRLFYKPGDDGTLQRIVYLKNPVCSNGHLTPALPEFVLGTLPDSSHL